MGKYTAAKELVWAYFKDLDQAATEEIPSVLNKYLTDDYYYRGSYPNRELHGIEAVTKQFWLPLKTALSSMQRRVDIFIAGNNEFDDTIWVMGMGHFMGLFDNDILGIRHTNKMASLRFAEFSCVKDGKICQTGLFVDWIGLMQQANMYPLPPSTGQYFIYPGPRNHNGLLFEDAKPEEGEKTNAVQREMGEILAKLNEGMRPPTADELALTWSKNMIWYGPAGIGATYTIERYIKQHTGPFRQGLTDKNFVCHKVRFAEGNFACFFGWPNLTNRAIGGFMGLTSGDTKAEMMVVDVYSREEDKLAENWVIIDIPYWLAQQGLDVFKRTADILNG